MYNPLLVGLYHNEPDACEPDGIEPDTTTVAVPPPTGEPFNNNEPEILTDPVMYKSCFNDPVNPSAHEAVP